MKKGAGGLLKGSSSKRRFVLLDGVCLRYYKDASLTKEQGNVHMASVKHVNCVMHDGAKGGAASFELVTEGRTFVFSPELTEEKGGEEGGGGGGVWGLAAKDRDAWPDITPQLNLVARWTALLRNVIAQLYTPRPESTRSAAAAGGAGGAGGASGASGASGGASGAAGASVLEAAAAAARAAADECGREYVVNFAEGPLYMDLEPDATGTAVVTGFTTAASGGMGAAEASGQICAGDFLVGVNGANHEALSFPDFIDAVVEAGFPKELSFRVGDRKAKVVGAATGWMLKKGEGGSKALRRRYFKLEGCSLNYFKPGGLSHGSNTSVAPRKTGTINMNDVLEIAPILDLSGDAQQFRIELLTTKRTWVLVPDSEPSLRFWVRKLRDSRTESPGSGGGGILVRDMATDSSGCRKQRLETSLTDEGGEVTQAGWVFKNDDFCNSVRLRRFAVLRGTRLLFFREEVNAEEDSDRLAMALASGAYTKTDIHTVARVHLSVDDMARKSKRLDEVYGMTFYAE